MTTIGPNPTLAFHTAQARIVELEKEVERMREALKKIADLAGTEKDEWDCVERVMPQMEEIARAAIEISKGV